MSENTNKIFWITLLGLVVTAIAVLIFFSVTKPTKTFYDGTNSTSLCASSYGTGNLLCLDASNNSNSGEHTNNNGNNKNIWYIQNNLGSNASGSATLQNFNFNDDSGWLPYALKFDGIDDNVKLDLTNIDFNQGLTIQVNVKPLTDNKDFILVDNNNIKLEIKNNKVIFILKTNTGTYTLEDNHILTSNSWYLIHATYNNDRMKIYINGKESVSEEISGTITNTSNDFIIGQNFKGELSSILIYNIDIDTNGINQNTNSIYEKVYSIDRYRENFIANNSCYEWSAPITGEYQIELWGAQGGAINGGVGGKGAYTTGNRVFKKDDKIYVCVGSKGTTSTNTAMGGGATDIRLEFNGNLNDFNSLKTRVMVAAGGGGGNNAKGGAGGMLHGLTSPTPINGIINATGGDQSAGGSKAIKMAQHDGPAIVRYTNGRDGYFGKTITLTDGATGGNGYFSGGSISYEGGGAGGSSYISGYQGSNGISETSTENLIVNSGISAHYSHMEFFSGKMINGDGNMPDYSNIDGTMYGKTNDGHARISFIASESVSIDDSNTNPEDNSNPIVTILAPGIPELKSFYTSDSTITATYSKVENGKSYACYYGTSRNEMNSLGFIITNITGDRQCNINGLEENTNYYVMVRAFNGSSSSDSEITEIKTDYKTPEAAGLLEINANTFDLSASYTLAKYATDYSCKIGENSSNLDIDGSIEKDDNLVICHKDNLKQNTKYYVQLTAINGDKSTESALANITTTYAEPEIPVLTNSDIGYESITNHYSSAVYGTEYECKYGINSNDLDKNGNVYTDSENNVVCVSNELTQGTEYYYQIKVINGNHTIYSDINKVRTNYYAPEVPEEISKVVTNNSITSNFSSVSNGINYSCKYGINNDNLDKDGTIINLIGGNKQCIMSPLNQNTTYYYRFIVTNGDKNANSQTYNALTDYNEATMPLFQSATKSGLNITSTWQVTGEDQEYLCEMSKNGNGVEKSLTPTINNNIATCAFTNLETDQTYYFRLKSINGTKNTVSDWHTESISKILPSISASIPSGTMNTNNWAKKNFDVTLNIESTNPQSILGVAYCQGTAKCTPSYTIEEEGEGELHNRAVASDSNTIVVNNPNTEFTTNVTISTQSATNYVCAQAFTITGKTTSVSCYGPYALDKNGPTITTSNISTTQFTSKDSYDSTTITDNLTADTKITKSVSGTVDYNTPGTYTVTYSATDLAGNTSTKSRTVTVNWYTTSLKVTPVVSGTTYASGKSGFTFDLKIEHSTGNVTKTGITHYDGTIKYGSKITLTANSKTGYTLTDGSKSATSAKNNITYKPTWTPIEYTISYTLNGGSVSSANKTKYTIETANFTLHNPTRTGYTFKGWSGTGLSGSSNTSVTISKGSTGNRSYTANWTINSYTVDVNPIIDGTTHGGGKDGFTFSVWVDGTKKATNVTDWCTSVNYGSSVRVVGNSKDGYNRYNYDITKTVGTSGAELKPEWKDDIKPTVSDLWISGISYYGKTSSGVRTCDTTVSASGYDNGVGLKRAEVWLWKADGSAHYTGGNGSGWMWAAFGQVTVGTRLFQGDFEDWNGNWGYLQKGLNVSC